MCIKNNNNRSNIYSATIDIQDEIKKFPTTRYQGSKRKIIPWIYDCIKDIKFQTVLDAFGGSGVVSYLFKLMKKDITFNDILRFNFIIGESIISNKKILLNDSDISFILNEKTKHKTFIADNFSEIYYLNYENIWLDKIIHNIERLETIYTGMRLKYKKAIAYNALFQSCLTKRPYNLFHRKNLSMRMQDVKRNFGNKTTWEKPFPLQFKKFSDEINSAVFDSDRCCKSLNSDIFAIRNIDYDLVYIDSPYIKKNTSNESSDYIKCYHFLEGISKYDSWSNLIDTNTINKRIKKDHISNYFTPKEAMGTFDKLIEKFKDSILVVSYKYGGIPSIDDLKKILCKYKRKIYVYDKHYKYALNSQNGNAILNREYILIGEQ
jgi:adenine-specific DNA-methyltransferase